MRPVFGILPPDVEAMMGEPGEFSFDNTTRGAAASRVRRDRLELAAEGFELTIATDAGGKLAPDTHVVFPIKFGGKPYTLRCRPGDDESGFLHSNGSSELSGRFAFKATKCENVLTGKKTRWPPLALSVIGNFKCLTPR